MCVLSIKVPIRKKSGNLSYSPRSLVLRSFVFLLIYFIYIFRTIVLIFVAVFITTFRPLYSPAFFRWLECRTLYFAYRDRLFSFHEPCLMDVSYQLSPVYFPPESSSLPSPGIEFILFGYVTGSNQRLYPLYHVSLRTPPEEGRSVQRPKRYDKHSDNDEDNSPKNVNNVHNTSSQKYGQILIYSLNFFFSFISPCLVLSASNIPKYF